MYEMLQRVVAYGCLGVLVEVIFTGIRSILRGNWNATGTSYLWMFLIYGAGGLLLETTHNILNWPGPVAALVYVVEIYMIEFSSGYLIKHWTGKIPWDYGAGKYTIMGLVRLDYAGFWYILSLAAHYLHPYIIKAVNMWSRL